jgi:hypothetical protein
VSSQEVARREEAQVPALAHTPSSEITADDIAIPRVKIGQFMSKQVQDELFSAGDVFSVTGSDDSDPIVLVKKGAKTGVRFYVLDLIKGLSYSDKEETGGDLLRWQFGDPEAHPKAWVTYNYVIAIPSVDTDIPFKFLLTRSGKPAAMKLNTVLKRAEMAGPGYEIAFELTTAERSNSNGKWYVAQVKQVDADPDEAKAVQELAQLTSAPAVQTSFKSASVADEPEI